MSTAPQTPPPAVPQNGQDNNLTKKQALFFGAITTIVGLLLGALLHWYALSQDKVYGGQLGVIAIMVTAAMLGATNNGKQRPGHPYYGHERTAGGFGVVIGYAIITMLAG